MTAKVRLTTFKIGLGGKNRFLTELSSFYCFFGLTPLLAIFWRGFRIILTIFDEIMAELRPKLGIAGIPPKSPKSRRPQKSQKRNRPKNDQILLKIQGPNFEPLYFQVLNKNRDNSQMPRKKRGGVNPCIAFFGKFHH